MSYQGTLINLIVAIAVFSIGIGMLLDGKILGIIAVLGSGFSWYLVIKQWDQLGWKK